MAFFRKKRETAAEQPKRSIPGSVTRGVFRTFANAPAWLGYPLLKEQSAGVFHLIKGILFRRFAASRYETFEQAMLRLNLTEQDIKQRARNIRIQFWVYTLMALLVLVYSGYLLFSSTLVAAALGFIVMCLCIMKAASMHFWLFQIKKRRLGCSMKEWFGVKSTEEHQ